MKHPDSKKPSNVSSIKYSAATDSTDDSARHAGAGLVLTPAEGRIAELRLAATDYVQRALATPGDFLDDSEESLAFVDHYIERVRSGGRLSEEVLGLVSVALGVYLGEVARTRFGGRWIALPPAPADEPADRLAQGDTPILDSIDEPAGWRLQLAAVPLIVDPIGMARQALQHPGPDDSPDATDSADSTDSAEPPELTGPDDDAVGFATTPALTAPLRAALARLPPVSVEYYYSLTGRFETIAYVVELLAELEQQEQQQQQQQDAAKQAPQKRARSRRSSVPSPEKP